MKVFVLEIIYLVCPPGLTVAYSLDLSFVYSRLVSFGFFFSTAGESTVIVGELADPAASWMQALEGTDKSNSNNDTDNNDDGNDNDNDDESHTAGRFKDQGQREDEISEEEPEKFKLQDTVVTHREENNNQDAKREGQQQEGDEGEGGAKDAEKAGQLPRRRRRRREGWYFSSSDHHQQHASGTRAAEKGESATATTPKVNAAAKRFAFVVFSYFVVTN